MKSSEAIAIFKNIYNSERSIGEKKVAIKSVLELETNGISKQDVLNALDWLVVQNPVYDMGKVLEKLNRRIVFLLNYKELLHKKGDTKSRDDCDIRIQELTGIEEMIKRERVS